MRHYLCMLMLFATNCSAVTAISIGADCNVAMALRNCNLRQASYPFDWTVSPFGALYQAFKEDFERFFHPDSLNIRMPDRHGVLDHYGFHFVHDLPSTLPNIAIAAELGEDHVTGGPLRDDWRDFIPTVLEKYHRRITRLNDLLSSSEKVYLIRLGDMTRAQAIQFRDLLVQKYPNLQFVLVVIGQTNEMKQGWNLENIKNFHVTFNEDDNHNLRHWKAVFEALGLI